MTADRIIFHVDLLVTSGFTEYQRSPNQGCEIIAFANEVFIFCVRAVFAIEQYCRIKLENISWGYAKNKLRKQNGVLY